MSKIATALVNVRSSATKAYVRPPRSRRVSPSGSTPLSRLRRVIVDPQFVRLLVEEVTAVVDDVARLVANRERPRARGVKIARRRVRVGYAQIAQRQAGADEAAGVRTVAVILAKVAFVGHHEIGLAEPRVRRDGVGHVEALGRVEAEGDYSVIQRIDLVALLAEILGAETNDLCEFIGRQIQHADRVGFLQRHVRLGAVLGDRDVFRLEVHAGVQAHVVTNGRHARQTRVLEDRAGLHVDDRDAAGGVSRGGAVHAGHCRADASAVGIGSGFVGDEQLCSRRA